MQYAYCARSQKHLFDLGAMTLALRPNPNPKLPPVWSEPPEQEYPRRYSEPEEPDGICIECGKDFDPYFAHDHPELVDVVFDDDVVFRFIEELSITGETDSLCPACYRQAYQEFERNRRKTAPTPSFRGQDVK